MANQRTQTAEEIYAKHHRTDRRPNPFCPTATLAAMEEYAALKAAAAVQEAITAYDNYAKSAVDAGKKIEALGIDLKKMYSAALGFFAGEASDYFASREKLRDALKHIGSKYKF